MSTQDEEKTIAGQAAAELVEDGMVLGLGTGSTVECMLDALGDKVKAGMKIRGVPTSERTATRCHELGIEVLDFASVDVLDLAIDGADEIDGNFQMIKGGGGALLREKIVASAAKQVAIMVDSTKVVDTLGAFPLPVEIVRFGYQQVERTFSQRGYDFAMRMTGGNPYITDNGNYILDCTMAKIEDPAALHADLNAMTGVVDNGLFIDLCHVLVIGQGSEAKVLHRS